MAEHTHKIPSYQMQFKREWERACTDVKKGLKVKDEPTPPKQLKAADGDIEGYLRLGNAVVENTVSDWRKAVRALRRNPRNKNAQAMLIECEDFLTSEYFNCFSLANGKGILDGLKREESTTYQIATSEIRRD